jgi:hypothetical protein
MKEPEAVEKQQSPSSGEAAPAQDSTKINEPE